ncbi:RICIN domain-containing protein [Ruminococcus albus]|uniref:Ricin-type beta-trefoil lectin domain-like n=1 Tax=Ruminococcus albus TaxID=1264 RepID=A0A1I1R1W8_RUMAL|nr:RICIN domain-containing protein [Ruminococcus albus]SFD26108.1 Ricin-type beta-trefoil lectin domain-like [Ruminococcus albus]
MKKLSKQFVSIFMTIVIVISILPMSAFAASYRIDYWNFSTPTRTLSMGSRGDDVKWLQCAINDLIITGDWKKSHLDTPKLDVDGAFGSATKAAVEKFQRNYGLSVDGYFGPKSLSKMLQVLYPRIPQPYTPTNPEPKIPNATNYYIDGVYFIRNKQTNKYLDVCGGSSYNNAKIVQYRFHGDLNQQFRISYENGFYKIYTRAGGNRCFDLWGPSEANTNGTDLKIYDSVSNCQQQNFILKKLGDGSFEIGSACSNCNKVLEVENSSNDDCATVQIYQGNGTKLNDDWYLEPVDDYTTKAPNQFNRAGNINTLGSVNYGGYRYKIITKDDVTSGMTQVKQITKNKINVDIFKAIADFAIAGDTDMVPSSPGLQTVCGIINSLTSSITNISVRLTLYKSNTSNLRYATIEVGDGEFQTILRNTVTNDNEYLNGYWDTKGEKHSFPHYEGRAVRMKLSTKHNSLYQFDGYIDANGEFCMALHTYAGDSLEVRENDKWEWNPIWLKFGRFTYGTDNRHFSVLNPEKASDNCINTLNQCIQ